MSAIIYEISNPHDAYTIAVTDFKSACIGIIFVGKGSYGLSSPSEKGAAELPPFIFGGFDEFWLQTFGETFAVSADNADWDLVAEQLESVLIGNRHDYEIISKHVTDPKALELLKAEWHDKKRTSMTNLGAACWKQAENCRKFTAKEGVTT